MHHGLCPGLDITQQPALAARPGRPSSLNGRTPDTAASAYTLVELLVAMAVMGLLLAVALPALQSARESARRTACGNRLRQIGAGLHAYHVAHKAFPPGGVEWRSPADRSRTKRQLAWSAFLLPFIDEPAVFRQLDFSKAFDAPENAGGATQVISTYLCPSAARTVLRVEGRGAIDYGGIYGERIDWPGRAAAERRNDPPKGVMLYDRRVKIRDIRDGTSHTLMVSEDSAWRDGQWINGRNIFDQAFEINNHIPFENDIRSNHSTGAQGLLADGSVHFLHEDMDLRTLAAICTRARGDIVRHFP